VNFAKMVEIIDSSGDSCKTTVLARKISLWILPEQYLYSIERVLQETPNALTGSEDASIKLKRSKYSLLKEEKNCDRTNIHCIVDDRSS